MEMTQEKAIKHLKALKARCERLVVSSDRGPEEWQKDAESLDMALSALRPVSREQVEKVWRGEWITPTIIGGRAYNIPHCSACNGVPCGTDEHTRFCAHCGAPMTDEAVQMVMERMEAISE